MEQSGQRRAIGVVAVRSIEGRFCTKNQVVSGDGRERVWMPDMRQSGLRHCKGGPSSRLTSDQTDGSRLNF